VKNFLDKEEYKLWKTRCIKQRYIAAQNPCSEMAMSTCTDYEVSCGPWNLRLCLERYIDPPQWHASISYFKEIGNEIIRDKATGLPIFEAPQDALLLVKDWNHEELDVARSLLGDLMGPLIAGKTQLVREMKVPFGFALHWLSSEKDVNDAMARRN
jgi:hypothetical protein